MLIVILALGTTDLLFALDSIPAIYGLTKEPYLVLTANIFALMGLRQLYFLIGGLLKRLVYLSIGLAVLLGFIGVKLFLHALHENNLPFINGGEPFEACPTSRSRVSLGAIVLILGVTTIASLLKTRRDARAVAVVRPTRADRLGHQLADAARGLTSGDAGVLSPSPRRVSGGSGSVFGAQHDGARDDDEDQADDLSAVEDLAQHQRGRRARRRLARG